MIKSSSKVIIGAACLLGLAFCLAVTVLILVSMGVGIPFLFTGLLLGSGLLTMLSVVLFSGYSYQQQGWLYRLRMRFNAMQTKINSDVEPLLTEKIADKVLSGRIQNEFNRWDTRCAKLKQALNDKQMIKYDKYKQFKEKERVLLSCQDISVYWQTKYQDDLSWLKQNHSDCFDRLSEKYQELKEVYRTLEANLTQKPDKNKLESCLLTEYKQLRSQDRSFDARIEFLKRVIDLYHEMLRSTIYFGPDYQTMRDQFLKVVSLEWYKLCEIYYTDAKNSSFSSFDFLMQKSLINKIDLTQLIQLENRLVEQLKKPCVKFLQEELIAIERDGWDQVKQLEAREGKNKNTDGAMDFIGAVKVVDKCLHSNLFFQSTRAIYSDEFRRYLVTLAEKETDAVSQLSDYLRLDPEMNLFTKIGVIIKIPILVKKKENRTKFLTDLLAELNPSREVVQVPSTHPISQQPEEFEEVEKFLDFVNQASFDLKDRLKKADKAVAKEILREVLLALKKHYKKLALQYHPDKNPNTEEAKKVFQRINQIQMNTEAYLNEIYQECEPFIELNELLKEIILSRKEHLEAWLKLMQRYDSLDEAYTKTIELLGKLQGKQEEYAKKQEEYIKKQEEYAKKQEEHEKKLEEYEKNLEKYAENQNSLQNYFADTEEDLKDMEENLKNIEAEFAQHKEELTVNDDRGATGSTVRIANPEDQSTVTDKEKNQNETTFSNRY
jgi:hypothetical protein